ncbi:MAG: methylglyoxal synthase [Leptospiraceae bacterium]|nr:methylglyoxal synthase [Leptospiraceae bacterium]MCP5494218.1 methylglyoxal synthase [Leptospiraceae bacterium]
MIKQKHVALVAHDKMKKDMVEWVSWNKAVLSQHKLVCTGTTGRLIQDVLIQEKNSLTYKDFEVVRLKSGPLGGDQQLGAMIAEGKIDILIFFWDPMQPQPHDVDVKALLRIAVLYNLPTASNRASADFLISSPLFEKDYDFKTKDYTDYIRRTLENI